MRVLILPLGAALLAACAAVAGDSADAAVTAAAPWCANRALPPFCARCHGNEGRGDGQLAATLVPPPRDFSNPAWQMSVTDERIARVILEGGAAVGLSPAMPAHVNFSERPAVVQRLVSAVRSCSDPAL